MSTITITLPEPPSVNILYTSHHRISKVYRAWRKAAGWELLIQKGSRFRIAGPYTVLLSVYSKSRKDADGMLKATLDLLVAHHVTDDDRHCKRATSEKTGDQVGRCVVSVSSWDQPG